jgi:AcrR family transcriptional regulator
MPTAVPGRTRQEQTEQRRKEILDAALSTFNDVGESGTFIQEVCRRSGVSVGTLYHHFGSKDQLVATLHYTLLNEYQSGAGPILAADPPAEEGIRNTVEYHARWLVGHPEQANFLLQQPFAGTRSEQVPPELVLENEEFLATVKRWLEVRMDQGHLTRRPFDVVVALLIGPIHHWARAENFRSTGDRRSGDGTTTEAQSERAARRDRAIARLADGIWRALGPA